MGDNYFDEKLRDILESPPEYEPDALALQDMQQRLRDRGGGIRGRTWFPWVLSAILFLLLAGAAVLFQQLAVLQSQVQQLEDQLTTVQSTTDTIIHQQIIQHYDTIYTIIYKEKYLPVQEALAQFPELYEASSPSLFWGERNGGLITSTGNNQGLLSWSLDENRYSLLERSPSSSFFSSDTLATEKVDDFDFWANKAFPLEGRIWKQLSAKRSWETAVVDGPTLPIKPYKKSTISPLYYFTPIGLAAKAVVDPVVLPSHDLGGSSYAFGAGFEIKLPQNRSLEIGGEWLSMKFELKDPAEFGRFPILDPEDPADVLHELKGDFSYLQIPVSLRQQFLPNKNWSPSISIGMVAVKPIRQRLEYEYIDGQREYKLSNNAPSAPFSVRNLRIGAASQIQLNRRLSINPAVQYQHAFETQAQEFFPLRYWSLRLGLQYDFSE